MHDLGWGCYAIQSFDVHSVILGFFRHLNFNPLLFLQCRISWWNCSWRTHVCEVMTLMHLSCGGYVTEFWFAFSLFRVLRHLNFNPLLFLLCRISWWNCSRRAHFCEGLILMHLGCCGYVTEFWCAFSLLLVFWISWWNCLRRPHVCEGTDFWCTWVVVVILQSFGVHSVFLWFFRHLQPPSFSSVGFCNGTAQEELMSVKDCFLKALVLLMFLSWSFCHVGCGVCFLWGMFEAKVSHIEGLWQFWKL